MFKKIICVSLFVLIVSSLYGNENLHKYSDNFLIEYIKLIENGKYKKAIPLISEEAKKSISARDIVRLFDYIKSKGKASKFESVGSNIFQTEDLIRINKTFQLTYKDKYALVTAQIIKEKDSVKINGFNFNEMNSSLEAHNKFSFSGKGLTHYFFLGYAVLIPLFIVVTFIIYLRTRFNKKWRWALFILVGLVQFSFNWTTGGFMFKLIHFQILGSGYQYTAYSPVVIMSSIPLGAVLFLRKRRKLFSVQTEKIEDSRNMAENSDI